MLARRDNNEMSPRKISIYVKDKEHVSDDDDAPVQINRKLVHRFSDSDTEKENIQDDNIQTAQDLSLNNSDSEDDSSYIPLKSGLTKSRIRIAASSSESDVSNDDEAVKNMEQQIRMKNKRNKLKDKFKGLLNSREKQSSSQPKSDKQSSDGSHSEVSDPSESEMSSIAKIKQKIKKSMASVSSICDPDTSDDESHMNKKQISKQRQRKDPKSMKLTEPKPIRMSAKQAMENMQMIKSESNRMLREKAVSLPYHRPKALSLKDIMSRRKPAISSDGKVLPIKMNEEQLKQYASLLEQRQKEMMELCKSESDDDTPETEEKNDKMCQETEKLCDNYNMASERNLENSSCNVKIMETDSIDTKVSDADKVNKKSELVHNDLEKTGIAEAESTKYVEENVDIAIKSPDIIQSNNQLEGNDQNCSNTDLKLVYNDSVEDDNIAIDQTENLTKENIVQNAVPKNCEPLEHNEPFEDNSKQRVSKINSETESQLISLHYTEKNTEDSQETEKPNDTADKIDMPGEEKINEFFSDDDDVNMEDIDKIIENAEIMKDNEIVKSPMLTREHQALNAKPKLMGAPGMVIDLDGGTIGPKKLSGVEILKERFIYFSKLKTPEELEREKEKKLKPGAQHLKLKQELEEKISEQRSLEWAKRLEEEKQQHKEMETILDNDEDSFEKIEGELEESNDNVEKEEKSSSESEEELEEFDVEIKDKPRKHNPMVDDEAEESDCGENESEGGPTDNCNQEDDENDNDPEDVEEEESSDDEDSSESEEEIVTENPKKSRILKAFEDSDDEDVTIYKDKIEPVSDKFDSEPTNNIKSNLAETIPTEVQTGSQDDIIQLAQVHKSVSDDLTMSQQSCIKNKDGNSAIDEVLGTQTFSILDSTAGMNVNTEIDLRTKLDVICVSQPYHDPSLNGMVDGSQLPITQSSQSQPIGEDILALCTGKFYDNEFVSQNDEHQYVDIPSQESELISNDFIHNQHDTQVESSTADNVNKVNNGLSINDDRANEDGSKIEVPNTKLSDDGNLLKSMLDELDDPEFDKPKTNKFFTGGNMSVKGNKPISENSQLKKKFIIDSDEETAETILEVEPGKKKKPKKKRPEKRALQISDDEEEEEFEQEEDEYMSGLEEDTERVVEYDSEENEIEVQPDKPKQKRKVADFFEQEAELTSEDEWVGSGDEDEKDLDRMEREEGDDEVFHQGKLRRELGQIHMRDVLDQDKREVRLIQELLFEDGDLGGGSRQRKFRWRNAGEDDETGTVPDEFGDTQEEEFESEEQWRKQRHEREVFLRQMQQQDEEEGNLNVSVNRTTIIKANLTSKSMSTLLQEVNQSKSEKVEVTVVQEKKSVRDIPSPKKSFSIFQQSYHGSLLTRGRGALARLAALATPLAADDDDAPKIGSLAPHKRNFVFAALTPGDDEPKVTIKRKADGNLGTPKLMKKMKIEDTQTRTRSSLLDHLNL